MKLYVYAIRDNVAGFFGAPIINHSDEMAIREFKFTLSHSQGLDHDFVGDFSLYRIGSYDNNTAELTPELPTIIFKGCEVNA